MFKADFSKKKKFSFIAFTSPACNAHIYIGGRRTVKKLSLDEVFPTDMRY